MVASTGVESSLGDVSDAYGEKSLELDHPDDRRKNDDSVSETAHHGKIAWLLRLCRLSIDVVSATSGEAACCFCRKSLIPASITRRTARSERL